MSAVRWWLVGTADPYSLVPLPGAEDPRGPGSAVVAGPFVLREDAVEARRLLRLAREVMEA